MQLGLATQAARTAVAEIAQSNTAHDQRLFTPTWFSAWAPPFCTRDIKDHLRARAEEPPRTEDELGQLRAQWKNAAAQGERRAADLWTGVTAAAWDAAAADHGRGKKYQNHLRRLGITHQRDAATVLAQARAQLAELMTARENQLLPGEDGELGQGLFIDLIPRDCWFTNARSQLAYEDWRKLRSIVISRAAGACEICPNPSPTSPLEVHERWIYNPHTRTQTLGRLICLCRQCHRATHYGLAMTKHSLPATQAHIRRVNHWNPQQLNAHIESAFSLWRARNAIAWELDLGILAEAGYAVTREPTARQRRHTAQRATTRH
jgi:5-methylcytosine-specific restriction endonuclease McrA